MLFHSASKKIGFAAFHFLTNLETLIIPPSVLYIDGYFFEFTSKIPNMIWMKYNSINYYLSDSGLTESVKNKIIYQYDYAYCTQQEAKRIRNNHIFILIISSNINYLSG